MELSFKEIITEQKQSLDYKIDAAKVAIKSGFAVCHSCAALAFSGGKDSTVLWHIIRTYFPEQAANMAVIFGNTGVEYPESLKFAREIGHEWGGNNFYEVTPERLEEDGLKYNAQVQVLNWLIETGGIKKVLKADGKLKNTKALENACPGDMWDRFKREGLVWKAGAPKSYWWCADQYGYPIMGKAASKLQARRINIDCFLRFGQTSSHDVELKRYYDMLRRVKISQGCCDILKKEPSKQKQRELKVDLLFLGMMASESHRRKLLFASNGSLFEVVTESRKIGLPVYHCHPLSIWTDEDIWAYIHRFNVPYSPLYDITYKSTDGCQCKMRRNGCVGCYTDYGRKDNHMYVLRQTHPAMWRAVMRYGMAAEIARLKAYAKESSLAQAIQIGLDDEMGTEYLDWAIDNRPCAFD